MAPSPDAGCASRIAASASVRTAGHPAGSDLDAQLALTNRRPSDTVTAS
jgi:hypothetical protein